MLKLVGIEVQHTFVNGAREVHTLQFFEFAQWTMILVPVFLLVVVASSTLARFRLAFAPLATIPTQGSIGRWSGRSIVLLVNPPIEHGTDLVHPTTTFVASHPSFLALVAVFLFEEGGFSDLFVRLAGLTCRSYHGIRDLCECVCVCVNECVCALYIQLNLSITLRVKFRLVKLRVSFRFHNKLEQELARV